MADVTNEQLHRELNELKGIVVSLKQGLSLLLPPLKEMELKQVARDVSRGNLTSLDDWNARKKAQRTKREDSDG